MNHYQLSLHSVFSQKKKTNPAKKKTTQNVKTDPWKS